MDESIESDELLAVVIGMVMDIELASPSLPP
jgi:hypothetical protein